MAIVEFQMRNPFTGWWLRVRARDGAILDAQEWPWDDLPSASAYLGQRPLAMALRVALEHLARR